MYNCSREWPTVIKKSESIVTHGGGAGWSLLKLPFLLCEAIFMIYLDASYGIYFKLCEVTLACVFFFSLGHCIFFQLSISLLEKSKNVRTLHKLYWLDPWKATACFLPHHYFLLHSQPHLCKGGRRETWYAACRRAEWVCGLTLLQHIWMCSSSAPLLKQVPWWICTHWSCSLGGGQQFSES